MSWPWTIQDQQHTRSTATVISEQASAQSQQEKTSSNAAQHIADLEATAPPPDRELWTRDLYIVGLILGWGAALACLATGIYIIASGSVRIPPFLFNKVALVGAMGYSWKKKTSSFIIDHRVYGVSEAAMIIIPLLLQIGLTCIFTCLDGIHSTTLRWALWREGRLRHTTNLRWFTCSRKSGPNSWLANLLSALSAILAYGGATVMIFPLTVIAALELERLDKDPEANPVNYDADLGPDRFGIDFNAWGLIGLGTGLLLQSAICTWCLVHESAKYVETWNSNPLATARACRYIVDVSEGHLCTAESAADTPPRLHICEFSARQPAMCTLVPDTRKIANGIWAIFGLYSILAIVNAAIAVKDRDTFNMDFVNGYRGRADWSSPWRFFGEITFTYSDNSFKYRREWIGLLIQCAAIAVLLFGLHLAEVLGGLARDEATWRRATTGQGTSQQSSMLLETLRSWPSCVIFVYKALVPWIFSYGFSCLTRVFLNFYPLLTIALLFFALALFAEYLIRVQPRGPQPATYGDVQALVALVDDWDYKTLFWGDKGVSKNDSGVRVAGIAGRRLADLQPGVMYQGLDRELALRSA